MKLETLRTYKTKTEAIASIVKVGDVVFAIKGEYEIPLESVEVEEARFNITPSYYRRYGDDIETILECKDGIQIGRKDWISKKKVKTNCDIYPIFDKELLYDELKFETNKVTEKLKITGLLWLLEKYYFCLVESVIADHYELLFFELAPSNGVMESVFGGKVKLSGVKRVGKRTYVAKEAEILEYPSSKATEKYCLSDIAEINRQIDAYKKTNLHPSQESRIDMIIDRIKYVSSRGKLLNDSDITTIESILNSYR